ncbi:SURF1 family protein [Novosphingobium sp. YJ-S2-02]|uniref:SURF1-like protein n=1 Tax=Novosphingobium aureum TaxID=2792964 RepID=A0A931HA05_9SPHN|nr:SURF1 family protein [Novosphingobium aureum]MBH0111738.1 SURF1 family protein [Novosphingobium aureum]
MARIPIFSTLVVLAAVAVMIGLGVWQLERRGEKEALLARFAAASGNPAVVNWDGRDPGEDLLYRKARLTCLRSGKAKPAAGRNAQQEVGWAQVQDCVLAGGGTVPVVLGWTRGPYGDENAAPGTQGGSWWNGGEAQGVIAPGPRLVAAPPLGGLAPNAMPDPSDLANNHLSYAIQWFAFALTALVIYALLLRKRLRAPA